MVGLPAFPTFNYLPILFYQNSGVVLKAYYSASRVGITAAGTATEFNSIPLTINHYKVIH